MAFITSLIGKTNNNYAVTALSKQVQSTFSGQVRNFSKMGLVEEVLQTLNSQEGSPEKTFQESIDDVTKSFKEALIKLKDGINPIARQTTQARLETRIAILNALPEFTNQNQTLIREVQLLRTTSPQNFAKAIEALKKQAGEQVANAIVCLAELNMNGITPSTNTNPVAGSLENGPELEPSAEKEPQKKSTTYSYQDPKPKSDYLKTIKEFMNISHEISTPHDSIDNSML